MKLKPLPALPLLDPAVLDRSADEAARALMREGSSANTAASYRAAMRYWAAWFELRYGRRFALPLPETAVVQFVVDHARRQTEQGLTSEMPAALDQELVRLKVKGRLGPPGLNTVLQRVSVLSKAHDTLGLPNPCRAQGLRDLLARTRRAHARRGARAQAGLTREPLQALLDTCDDSLRGLRDRALLLFAWASGGRRRSEVVRATIENTPRGRTVFFICCATPRPTRRAPPAEDAKPIVGAAARALQAWLDASGIAQGPLFRRIRRGDVLGEPLAAAAVRDIVRQRCELAGLDESYSAHSLRSGFITEAGRQQVPLGDAMAMTGHASVATAMGYYRAGAAATLKAARLFDLAATEQPAARETPAMPAPPDSATTWRAPARS